MEFRIAVDVEATSLADIPRMESLRAVEGIKYACAVMAKIAPKHEQTVKLVKSRKTTTVIVYLTGLTEPQPIYHDPHHMGCVQVTVNNTCVQLVWHKHLLNQHLGERKYVYNKELAKGGVPTVVKVSGNSITAGVVGYGMLLRWLLDSGWVESLVVAGKLPKNPPKEYSKERVTAWLKEISEDTERLRACHDLMSSVKQAINDIRMSCGWEPTTVITGGVTLKDFFKVAMRRAGVDNVPAKCDENTLLTQLHQLTELLCSTYIYMIIQQPQLTTIKGNTHA